MAGQQIPTPEELAALDHLPAVRDELLELFARWQPVVGGDAFLYFVLAVMASIAQAREPPIARDAFLRTCGRVWDSMGAAMSSELPMQRAGRIRIIHMRSTGIVAGGARTLVETELPTPCQLRRIVVMPGWSVQEVELDGIALIDPQLIAVTTEEPGLPDAVAVAVHDKGCLRVWVENHDSEHRAFEGAALIMLKSETEALDATAAVLARG